MNNVFNSLKSIRLLRENNDLIDIDEYYNEIVKLSHTTKIDFSEIKDVSEFIHLYDDHHFDANETTSHINQELSQASESTDSCNIESANRKFFTQLNNYTPTFVRILKKTDFEDGVTNHTSDIVENFIDVNSFVTYSWLSSIYSNYQQNSIVLAGLLRIIELTIRNEDVDFLLPIVKAGLADKSSMVQEAAIMVIEQWRTKNCLDALETSSFQSEIMKSYAYEVLEELKEEQNETNA